MSITGDQSLLREINRMALVRVVQRLPGLSRAELAKETGLTKSTVSLLVQDLIDEGWLLETDAQVTGAIGRRPTPLFLDGARLAMVGADVGIDMLRVVTVSLTGEVVESLAEPITENDPSAVLRRVASMISHHVKRAAEVGRRLLGIGVGIPGAVLEFQGLVKLSPNFPWRDVPVKIDLARELEAHGVTNLPIHVQNDYDVAALGEYEFGVDPMPDPMIYLGIGVGVGAGIIVRDRLFIGAEGFAGEVGHSILQLEGPVCSCGRHGCAEAFIGLRAISTQITGHSADLLPISTLRDLLARNDAATILAVRRAGHYLGVLIQNLWTSFNPGRLVLGGPSCDLGDPLLDAARVCLERYAKDCGLPLPEICLSKFGDLSVAVGGAALVKHALLRPLDLRYRNP